MKMRKLLGCAGTAVIAFCVMTAHADPNTLRYEASFEGYTNGQAIAGTGGWEGSPESLIVADYTYDPAPAGGFPLPLAEHNKVLQLESDATNLIDSGEAVDVWVDFLVKPNRWEDAAPPDNIPADAHLAFFVDTNGYLNIYHADNGASEGVPSYGEDKTWSVVDVPELMIGEDEWARLTVHLDYSIPDGMASYFRVMINGTWVTHTNAHLDPSGFEHFQNGSWFPMAKTDATKMNALLLRNTGMFDDIVVDAVAPTMYYTLAASAVGKGSIAPSGNVQVEEGQDQAFTFTPDDGYSLEGVTYVENGVTNILGPEAIGYTFTNVTMNGSIIAYFEDPPGNGLAWWLTETGIEEGEMTPDLWKAYIASSDPEDPDDFAIVETWKASDRNYIKWYSIYVDTSLPPFGILRSTNLVEGAEGFAQVDSLERTPSEGANRVTNIWSESSVGLPVQVYYRVVATNAPPEE